MKNDKRTQQEKQPHASLVQVRNSIEAAKGVTRLQAAGIANNLTDEQCEAVLAAGAKKGQAATKAVLEAIEPILEVETETDTETSSATE